MPVRGRVMPVKIIAMNYVDSFGFRNMYVWLFKSALPLAMRRIVSM